MYKSTHLARIILPCIIIGHDAFNARKPLTSPEFRRIIGRGSKILFNKPLGETIC